MQIVLLACVVDVVELLCKIDKRQELDFLLAVPLQQFGVETYQLLVGFALGVGRADLVLHGRMQLLGLILLFIELLIVGVDGGVYLFVGYLLCGFRRDNLVECDGKRGGGRSDQHIGILHQSRIQCLRLLGQRSHYGLEGGETESVGERYRPVYPFRCRHKKRENLI